MFRSLLLSGALAASFLATTPDAPPSPIQQQTVQSNLRELRAGATRTPALDVGQREELELACQSAPDLALLRAGGVHLDNHDVKVIAITAAVVLAIVIIA